MSDITRLLDAANGGDAGASRELFSLLYVDLKRLAHARLRASGARAELETTALVHETFLRLAGRNAPAPRDRPAFFAYVGKVMHGVVLDVVRERHAQKRGGGMSPVTLTTGIAGEVIDEERLLAIDEAMNALARLSPELHALVEMRYFAGLSIPEIADITGRSARTLEREWQKARAFLRELMVET